MFRADYHRHVQEVQWQWPSPDVPKRIRFIEAWTDTDPITNEVRKHHQSDWLLDSEIYPWLHHEGRFKLSGLHNDGTPSSNGFRLLFCERNASIPRLPMSKRSFDHIERAFQLSPLTMSSLLDYGGVHIKQYRRHNDTNSIEGVNIVVKATAKYEVSHTLLSLHHHFDRRWTTAFLCDRNMFTPPLQLIYRSDAEPYPQRENEPYLRDVIEHCPSLWSSPLFLPTLILQNCCRRNQLSQTMTNLQLTRLEGEIGITAAGRSNVTRSLETWPADMDFKAVTIGLHSIGAELVFLTYVSAWTCDCARFLLELGLEFEKQSLVSDLAFEPIKDQLDYLLCIATTSDRFLRGYQERVQAQTSVLYSAISQRDSAESINFARLAQQQSELSIKLTKLTKRDSVAMTAFTFITALFLPATAVATLFSMPMFGWGNPPDVSSNSVSVTPNFWVYWVVTAPLTIVVMAGWFAWYFYKNSQWEKDDRNDDLHFQAANVEQKKEHSA